MEQYSSDEIFNPDGKYKGHSNVVTAVGIILAIVVVGVTVTLYVLRQDEYVYGGYSSGARSSYSSALSKNNFLNGHEYVDLGLSVKWATCNIGASSPSEYGDYYAWGETETKSGYTKENSLTYKKGGFYSSIVGNKQYDVARANWGGTWRLPTASEMDELINECTLEWTVFDGHNGYEVTGPNGNSIFLPAAGWTGVSLRDLGERGVYWTGTPNANQTTSAYYMCFDKNSFRKRCDSRCDGQSIRPVLE